MNYKLRYPDVIYVKVTQFWKSMKGKRFNVVCIATKYIEQKISNELASKNRWRHVRQTRKFIKFSKSRDVNIFSFSKRSTDFQFELSLSNLVYVSYWHVMMFINEGIIFLYGKVRRLMISELIYLFLRMGWL